MAPYRSRAREALTGRAAGFEDESGLDALLAAAPARELPRLWAIAVDRNHRYACPLFLTAFEKGLPSSTKHQVRDLATALRACGEEERAQSLEGDSALVAPAEPAARSAVDDDDASDLRRHGDYLRSGALPERNDVEGVAKSASDRLVAEIETWAREEPDAVLPPLYLAFHHEHAGRADRALEVWQRLVDRHPDEPDLLVAMGAAALRLDRPATVRRVAERLRSRAVNARQKAEADYLLGRLARREGRWEEASDRLSRYFLLRIRYRGCQRTGCDAALVHHLVEAGDRERLSAYLTARTAAIAEYEDIMWTRPPPRPIGFSRAQTPSERLEVDPDLLALTCESPRALEWLRKQAASAPTDDTAAARLEGRRGPATVHRRRAPRSRSRVCGRRAPAPVVADAGGGVRSLLLLRGWAARRQVGRPRAPRRR